MSIFVAGTLIMTACTKQESLSPAGKTTLSQAPGLMAGTAANLSIPTVNLVQSQDVSLFAGSGAFGLVDGAPAFADFGVPEGIAVDGSGNTYVADAANNAVRKIARDGTVSTLAGTGDFGFSNGINGFATFGQPYGAAVDAAGNIYVADVDNNVIRKVTQNGTTTTFAGNGRQGYVDNPDPGQAEFNSPFGVAIDAAGNVYVMDGENSAVRKITPAGAVSTLAVDTAYHLALDLAADAAGNVYVANHLNQRIFKITPSGIKSVLAGNGTKGFRDGPGANSEFNLNTGIAADGSGNVFVTDGADNLRKITPAGMVSTLSGSNFTLLSAAGAPGQLAIDHSGNFYVTEEFARQVFKITTITPATVSTVAGNGSQGLVNTRPAISEFFNPAGIVIDAVSGNIYIADENNNAIRRITPSGQVSTLAGGAKGFADGNGSLAKFSAPTGITVDGSGNIYVADCNNHRIRLVTPDGVVTTLAGTSTRGFVDGADTVAEFNFPVAVAVDAIGNVYVADADNNRIRKISAGQVSTLAGNGLAAFADGGPAVAEFRAPTGVAVDATGNVYVADQGNNRIREITAAGVVRTLAGSSNGFLDATGAAARFNQPVGLVVDGSGTVYVTDQHNNRIRKITPAGVVTTLAGDGTPALLDGYLGLNAEFNLPFGIAISRSGSLYISDWQNNVIRLIQ